jgi:hypothetical protein
MYEYKTDVHGYSHCMPYGWTMSELLLAAPRTRPLVSCTVPFVWRLSPLHPGYVMTMWEETREASRERREIARTGDEQGRSIVEGRWQDALVVWDDCGAGTKVTEKQKSVWSSFSVQSVEFENVLHIEVVKERSSK